MRGALKRASAVAALLVLSSSWGAGWTVAFHVAGDHHHDETTTDHHAALGLEMIVHGHAHGDETPAHHHPTLASLAVPVVAKALVLASAMIGDAPELVAADLAGRRLVSAGGPTHDPPPRLASFSVLRI